MRTLAAFAALGTPPSGPPAFSVVEAREVVTAIAHPKGSDLLPGAVQIVALAVLVEHLVERVADLEAKR